MGVSVGTGVEVGIRVGDGVGKVLTKLHRLAFLKEVCRGGIRSIEVTNGFTFGTPNSRSAWRLKEKNHAISSERRLVEVCYYYCHYYGNDNGHHHGHH